MAKRTPSASRQRTQKQSDPAYKQFFSSKGMVKSLLQTLIPKDFVTRLDLDTLEPCKAAYVSDKRYKQFFDDIVWRANWKEGGYCYLYLVFEFQSRNEWYMAVRMLVYTAMLYLELIRCGQVKSGDKLPLVFPLVIYNNAPKWSAKLHSMTRRRWEPCLKITSERCLRQESSRLILQLRHDSKLWETPTRK